MQSACIALASEQNCFLNGTVTKSNVSGYPLDAHLLSCCAKMQKSYPPLHKPGTHTTIGAWGRIISECLKDSGVDAPTIFAQAGLDHDLVVAPNYRLPDEKLRHLYPLCESAIGVSNFSFLLGSYVKAHSLHALGMAVLASSSVDAALQRIRRHSAIVSDSGHFDIIYTKDRVRFEVDIYKDLVGMRLVPPVAMESFLIGVLDMIREITSDQNFNPVAVHLCTTRPDDLTPYSDFFCCPVTFDCKREALMFRRSDIERPVRYANEPLAREHDLIAERVIQNISLSFEDRLYRQILKDLPGGDISTKKMAAQLNMSIRKLQGKLQQRGTCYQKLIDRARRELACQYLDDGCSLAEISVLLGFANSSGFCRAFKRWFDTSPTEYRISTSHGRINQPLPRQLD